jgi:hypothetical protein
MRVRMVDRYCVSQVFLHLGYNLFQMRIQGAVLFAVVYGRNELGSLKNEQSNKVQNAL